MEERKSFKEALLFHIIGMGPSSEYFSGGENTIGVNDVWSRHKTRYVVCIDPPTVRAFTPDRVQVIRNCRPEKFFTNRKEWIDHPAYSEIKLHLRGEKGLKHLDDLSGVPSSLDSTYVAACIAYRMGAKNIVM